MGHYYTNDENLKHDYDFITTKVSNITLELTTDAGVFSKSALDFGTRVLLETMDILENEKKILDMGCGYGPIGIFIAKKYENKDILMADVNLRALDLVRINAKDNQVEVKTVESNMFEHIKDSFNVIISNPPIRTGKKVIYSFYKDAQRYLEKDGKLWLVVGKKQGADSTVTYLETLYSKVSVVRKHKGFYVILAIK